MFVGSTVKIHKYKLLTDIKDTPELTGRLAHGHVMVPGQCYIDVVLGLFSQSIKRGGKLRLFFS